MNRPGEIVEYYDLDLWLTEALFRNLEVVRRDGKGEDPFTHYYAIHRCVDYDTNDNSREGQPHFGYFGDANGADTNHGIFAINDTVYNNWMNG
jgi:hypothetical protein